jgi:hypothetical protein
MTYRELSHIKTAGFETNCIIDDVVNNARFCYHKSAFLTTEVSAYDLNKIRQWAEREGVTLPAGVAA